MEFDIATIVYLVIAVMVLAPIMMIIISWLIQRSRAYILKANDAHQALYRKHYKSAKTNLKSTTGIRLERLYMEGDPDFYSMDYGKLKGIIWGVHAIEVFWKPSRISFARWGIIPRQLVRDPLSRNLRCVLNGLTQKGIFYVPNYCGTLPSGQAITEDDVQEFENTWKAWEKHLLLDEKSIEIEEQKVHCIPESLQASREATRVVNRDDHLQRQETTEPRGNADDNAEEF